MASFWGEILPVSSRAVDDDDDSENEDDDDLAGFSAPPAKECELLLNPVLGHSQVSCGLLVVAVGEAAVAFVDAALLWRRDAETVAIINAGFAESDGRFPPKSLSPSTSCTIHRLPVSPSVVVARVTASLLPSQLSSWQRLLFSRLEFTDDAKVVTLSCINAVHYLAETSAGDPPYLRSLATSAAYPEMKSCPIPRLEPPNLVTGAVAQLLTACEIARHPPAAAFVAFAPAPLDAAAAASFAQLLRLGRVAFGLEGAYETNPQMTRDLAAWADKQSNKNALYT